MSTSSIGRVFRSSQIVRRFCSSLETPTFVTGEYRYTGRSYVPPEDDGCDYKHWLIHVKEPRGSRDEMIASYFKIVGSVLGSEDEAKKTMYSVSTKYYFGIGVAVPENIANKFRNHPSVVNIMPDLYADPVTKDYGGEPVVDGQVAPYHPRHHDLYHRGQEAIRQGMIEEGIKEFPGQAAYDRLLKEYNSDKEKRENDGDKPKRPPSAFSLFMKDFRQQFKEQNPDVKGAALVKKAGDDRWRSMTHDDRLPFLCMADLRKRDYQKEIKAYENEQAGGNDGEESDKSKSKVNDEEEDDD